MSKYSSNNNKCSRSAFSLIYCYCMVIIMQFLKIIFEAKTITIFILTEGDAGGTFP
jgi:hypothetical protein